ncbi:MAG: hypothetical protein ACJAY8_000130 [Sphingobacteriales bacterium]|jgi:hypothetical protein
MPFKSIFKIFLLPFFLFFIPEKAFSQYIGGAKNETAKSFCHLVDSYYLIGSTRSYGEGSEDVYTIKINPALNTEWERTWGYPSQDAGMQIIPTKDNKLVYTAFSWESPGPGFREDLFVSKTDLNGEEIWTTHFGGSDTDRPFDIIQTNDSGYVITGLRKVIGSLGGSFVLKLNKGGNLEFQKSFVLSYKAIGKSIAEGPNSNLFLVVENNSFIDNNVRSSEFKGSTPTEVWLFRLGSSGNEIWRKKISGTGFNLASEIKIHNDKIYIVGSSEENTKGNFDMSVTELNLDGDVLNRYFFGGPNFEYGKTLDFDDQDNWYITGTTGGGKTNLFPKMYVVKANPDGSVMWEKEYGSDYSNYGVKGQVINPDKIALLGTSTVQEGTDFNQEIYFVIINSIGDVIREVNEVDSGVTSTFGPMVNFYPNPTQGKITLQWSDKLVSVPTLFVYDLRGKTLIEEKLRSNNVQFEFEKPGIYSYRLVFDNQLFYGKIQVN